MFYVHPRAFVLTSLSPENEAKSAQEASNDSTRRGQVINKRLYRSEDENKVSWALDMPGVKAADVSIEHDVFDELLKIHADRKKGGEVMLQYVQAIQLDETIFNTSKIDAELIDGVLTVSVQKKSQAEEPKPVDVDVKSAEAPEHAKNEKGESNEWRISIDMPGVKASNVTVHYEAGELKVVGKRVRGEASVHVGRNFMINPKLVDVNSLEGYLSDGVLVLKAIKKEKAGPRKVKVSTTAKSANEAEQDVAMASDANNDNIENMNVDYKDAQQVDSTNKDSEVNVETVDDKEDEWHEVDAAKKNHH
jgi:HSP20 family molecular chaperone IbpA